MAGPDFVFAHLADAHVGAWPRDAALRAALRESVLRAIEVVEERDCAFLLISGDLFHTPVPDPSEVAPIAAALRQLIEHGRRVYAIYGSHDYVAHRTSWLDVLSESGVFVRVAPEAVRAEGDRFSLPFVVDPPTGAVIAGVSGRSHGLDRAYFAAIDSEEFRAQPGFKIFQFHSAVNEYLPPVFREHIRGVALADLPGGCQYYAGGHIHVTYRGEGPEGGLLVNPGAVFGTSVTDLENGAAHRTHQGVAIVTVRNGVPEVEIVDTAPSDRLQTIEIDLSGKNAAQAQAEIRQRVAASARPGALVVPKLTGSLADGRLADLGLSATAESARSLGVETVHWDTAGVSLSPEAEPEEGRNESEIESAALTRLLADPHAPREFAGDRGARVVRELLRDLGQARAEGESKLDYEELRVGTALALLRELTPEE
jgi:DNA repair protein SbcD/Mre11